MAKIIPGQSTTITRLNVVAIAYAYEPQGDPPAPTLKEIRSYELIKPDGAVYQRKTVGRPCPPDRQAAIAAWFTDAQAELAVQEGL